MKCCGLHPFRCINVLFGVTLTARGDLIQVERGEFIGEVTIENREVDDLADPSNPHQVSSLFLGKSPPDGCLSALLQSPEQTTELFWRIVVAALEGVLQSCQHHRTAGNINLESHAHANDIDSCSNPVSELPLLPKGKAQSASSLPTSQEGNANASSYMHIYTPQLKRNSRDQMRRKIA